MVCIKVKTYPCVCLYMCVHASIMGSRVYGICNADVAFSNQIFELEQHKLSGMGGSDNGCGSGLLEATT